MKSLDSAALPFCLGVSALIAGCGGGSSSGSGGGGGGNTNPPTPTITSISPTTVAAGSADLTLTVNGTGFLSTTAVQVGGVVDPTTYVSSTKVTAMVSASQLVSGGELSVVALNGSSSSSSGAAVNLEVTNPSPAITATTPALVTVGTTSTVIAVAGTGFVPSTVINVNGSARTTTFISTTQVNVVLTAADVSAAGSLSLTAVNPKPGGGTSAAQAFAVNNPVPRVTGVSPSMVLTTATAPVTITVTGTNFVSGSTIQTSTSPLPGGTARATSFVSSTQLTFQLTASDLAQKQQLFVSVVNPAPGGGTGVGGPVNVLTPSPTPVITQVSPATFIMGSGDTLIEVSGTNLFDATGSFGSMASTINWNGTALTASGWQTGFNPGPQTLSTMVPANLLASTGTATITVTNPAATPSTSNSLTVTIENPPAPTLTSISPISGPINTAAQITLYGTGFNANSTVAVNGNEVSATYVSSTQMMLNLPATAVAVPGNVNITVTTPPPGGGTSEGLDYTA
jgi:hypothetical protein